MPSSVVVASPLVEQTANALEAITRLREIYTGSIGYDDEHIQTNEERYWLREAADSGRYLQGFDAETKRELLQRLTEVDAFEQSIHKRFPTEKRFSIEGTDMLVPMLDEIIHHAALAGRREVVLGMAHRGRLNVLANVLGKPYEAILEGFKMMHSDDNASVSGKGSQGFSGDVKYHLGYKRAFKEVGVAEMPLSLVPNPSHLEFVNPVAEGHARAAQEDRAQAGPPKRHPRASLAVLIHGDAAFPGQGVVPETLNMSQLPGYSTGGTIHIISNNQIGFTTLPSEGRSTRYASDLAKGFEIPIVHVNADDPIACIAAAHMAHDYRVQFGKDFLIDLIGYRRYGHNEAEEPDLTQPEMYAQVAKHPRVVDIWAQTLIREGVVTAEDAQTMRAEANARLDAAWNAPIQADAHLELDLIVPQTGPRYADTAVPAENLRAYNEALYAIPADFAPNEKLNRRTLQGRRDGLNKDNGILWGHAEALAFASILAEGTPIRITGQDTERGTFSHRHAVLHDIHTDARFVGLQTLPQARAAFAIYNSPLSEQAALGFEYGYSVHAPETLVLWEAQFGDFGNGAQIIIDQFLSAGLSKWRLSPSVVLLLPHGYEGQGPEHSSARLERYLQLCAEDNLRVANCTTPAQYFHLLRRQAALLKTDPRPLVVMTPKSLLRAPVAASSLSDLTNGTFQPVINDERAGQNPEQAEKVTRLILCSGKIYLDLVYKGGAEGKAAAPRMGAGRKRRRRPRRRTLPVPATRTGKGDRGLSQPARDRVAAGGTAQHGRVDVYVRPHPRKTGLEGHTAVPGTRRSGQPRRRLQNLAFGGTGPHSALGPGSRAARSGTSRRPAGASGAAGEVSREQYGSRKEFATTYYLSLPRINWSVSWLWRFVCRRVGNLWWKRPSGGGTSSPARP